MMNHKMDTIDDNQNKPDGKQAGGLTRREFLKKNSSRCWCISYLRSLQASWLVMNNSI